MALLLIGLDDTDTLESRGTGRLARQLAEDLLTGGPGEIKLLGVTRHQLLVDPRVPCTAHNSCLALLLDAPQALAGDAGLLAELFEHARVMMLADFIEGSDPGLCAAWETEARTFSEFGRRAKRELVSQVEALQLAGGAAALLQGLGGTHDGVIGALAAVGLAADGSDGRYVQLGSLRALSGLQPVSNVLAAGVSEVQQLSGAPVASGMVQCDRLRPARRGGRAVLVVERDGDSWLPLKLD
ncbi:MAG: ABC transporter substrate-binding protein [Chloroflexota bacterium]